MNCDCCQERLAEILDAPGEKCCAEVEAHLACCPGCCSVRDELQALADELPALAACREAPSDLAARIVARVPCPRRAGGGSGRLEAMHLVELRRVASFGLVFLGLWWQLAGGKVTTFANDEVVPRARAAMERAKAEVDETGVVPFVEKTRDRIGDAGRTFRQTLLGEKADQPGASAGGND